MSQKAYASPCRTKNTLPLRLAFQNIGEIYKYITRLVAIFMNVSEDNDFLQIAST